MSGASRAIYKAVKGILGSSSTDDTGSLVSELEEINGKTFKDLETKNKVEQSILKNRENKKLQKPKVEPKEVNPLFLEVDQTPKQKEMERARVLQREEDYIDDRLIHVVPGSRTDAQIREIDAFNAQMENLTTFNDAYGRSIIDPIGDRRDEVISFYSTIDNTIDEIFQRTAKNRPGERGIRGRELLDRFQRSNVKKAELNFIGFENRIKPDEFYTEADLKDIIDKSGIRITANIKKDNIIDGVRGGTKYSGFQRQVQPTDDIYNVYFPRFVEHDGPDNQLVVPLEYFEITLDISPNFKSYVPDSTDQLMDVSDKYNQKLKALGGHTLQGERSPHFDKDTGLTLAHMRGTIVELAKNPRLSHNLYDMSPDELKRRLIIEEFQSDVLKYLSPKYIESTDYTAPPLPFGNRARYLTSKKEELSKFDSKDYVAFSKDKERSEKRFFTKPLGRRSEFLYGDHQFFQFADELKENRQLFLSASDRAKHYPRFAEDVIIPGTDTVLIKKGKNISNKRLERMHEEGIERFEAKFYDDRGRIAKRVTIEAGEDTPSISLDDTTLELFEDPVAASYLKDGLISREDYIDASIEYTKSFKGEDYFGTIIKNPQEVDRKLPFAGESGITDYVEKLLQAAIVHAKQNNVDEIVIPNAEMMGAARGYKRGSTSRYAPSEEKGFILIAKIYDKAVSKALKKIEAESKGKMKVRNEVIDKNDEKMTRYLGSEKPKVRQMAYEQSSKVLDISKLDLNIEQIMARFSRGGLVTAPSSTGLMSR
jgi:hypothetical protein